MKKQGSGLGVGGSGCASRWALLVLLVMLGPQSARAHDRTNSYSAWDIHGRTARVVVRLAELDVTHLTLAVPAGPERDRMLGTHLAQHVQLLANDVPCPVTDGPRSLNPGAGRIAFEWQLTCPDSGVLQIRSTLLLDVAPSHLHFARVNRDAVRGLERVLSGGERTWDLVDASPTASGAQPQGTSLIGYITLGIKHILSGYDHLAFVLALLLIGGSFVEVAKVVTGFTVAHSITLGLAVLGYVQPERAPIEALIGLSIALVATENIWLLGARRWPLPLVVAAILSGLAIGAAIGHGRVPALTLAGLALFSLCYFGLLRRAEHARSLRWNVAFIFGLVHGFGFAAVLSEAGLPTNRLAHALLGFNVGVELGQLAVVSTVWPLLRIVTRGRERLYVALIEVGSSAIVALGLFWFLTRTYG